MIFREYISYHKALLNVYINPDLAPKSAWSEEGGETVAVSSALLRRVIVAALSAYLPEIAAISAVQQHSKTTLLGCGLSETFTNISLKDCVKK
jgi:hypothetical protein